MKTMGKNLGRETFLAPVTWKDGWPVVGHDGFVELQMAGGYTQMEDRSDLSVPFDRPLAGFPFLKVRVPAFDRYRLDPETKTLTLEGTCPIGRHLGHPTLLGLRQPEFVTDYEVKLDLSSLEEMAGIAVYHNSNYFYAVTVENEGGLVRVSLDRQIHGVQVRTESILLDRTRTLALGIHSDRQWYTFTVDGIQLSKAAIYGMSTSASFDGSFTGTLYAIWSAYGKATFLDGISLHAQEDDWVQPVLTPGSWI